MACTRRASSGRKATNASEAAHRRAAPQAPRVRHRPPHPAPAALPAPPSPAACIPRCGAPATHPPTHLHVQRLCRFVQIQQPPLRLIHQADELSGEQAQAGVVTAACTRVGRCSRGTVGSRCCPTGCTRHGRLAAGSAAPEHSSSGWCTRHASMVPNQAWLWEPRDSPEGRRMRGGPTHQPWRGGAGVRSGMLLGQTAGSTSGRCTCGHGRPSTPSGS